MADEPIDFDFDLPPGVEPPANPVKLKDPLRYQWSARVLLRIARGGERRLIQLNLVRDMFAEALRLEELLVRETPSCQKTRCS